MAEYIINTDAIPWEGFDKTKAVTFFGEPAQELIRCKNCKYWNRNNNRCAIFPCTEYILEDDYCSYAERKVDD